MNFFINIRDFIYYNRKYFIIGATIILILILYILFGTSNYQEVIIDEPIEKEIEEETVSDLLIVDIKGEILTPGIYEVEPDKRVMDIITLAGGLLEDADTSNINLSMKVEDEMVIIIPKIEEKTTETIVNNARIVEKKSLAPAKDSNGKISINNATLEELMTVKGIGEVKAKKIIEYRNTNGKFTSLEELTKVSGIGSKTFEKIKEYLTL